MRTAMIAVGLLVLASVAMLALGYVVGGHLARMREATSAPPHPHDTSYLPVQTKERFQ